MYLGVPSGADRLYWNAANIYGLIRYPMITANWEVVAFFAAPFNETNVPLMRYDYQAGFQPFVVLKNKRNEQC